jgi:hypothetical protein
VVSSNVLPPKTLIVLQLERQSIITVLHKIDDDNDDDGGDDDDDDDNNANEARNMYNSKIDSTESYLSVAQ